MTAFDLLFLACALAALSAVVRIAYLVVRHRTDRATRALRFLGLGTAIYLVVLIAVSAAQAGRVVPPGTPDCFDDWCIAVDSAAHVHRIGALAGRGEFVIVTARVLSRAMRRAQRETDVYARLLDDRGRAYDVSAEGQRALRDAGAAGSALTDFVAPGGANIVRLVFDVPSNAGALRFVTRHGWFPGALIVGGAQSLFHRPTVVPLPL